MYLKTLLRFFLLSIILATNACRSEQKEQQINRDSIAIMPDGEKEDSTLVTTSGIYEWLGETLKKPAISTKITLEETWNEDSLMVSPLSIEPGFYDDYRQVLRWSPDSQYVIDFGSYGMIATRDANGKVTLEAGEPDTELALLEPATRQRTRLMFVGPSSQVIDATWINNNEAIVVGTFDKTGDNNLDTLMWKINVREKLFRLYNVKSHR